MVNTSFVHTLTKDGIVNALGYEPVGGQGVNLLTGTKDFSGDRWDFRLSKWEDTNETYRGLKVIKSTFQYNGPRQFIDADEGDIFTLSAYVRTDADSTCKAQLYAGEDGTFARPMGAAFDINGNTFVRIAQTFSIIKSGSISFMVQKLTNDTIPLYVCGLKLEPGLVTNPVWTPSPQDVLLKGEVDGRNLFVMKDSTLGYISGTTFMPAHGQGETTSDYIDILPNEVFTIQTWATSNNIDDQYYMFDYAWYTDKNLNSLISKKRFSGGSPGFNHGIGITEPAPENVKYMRIVARLYSNGKVKVERGSIATPWTPAPEDVVVRSELEQAVVGENILNGTNTAVELLDGIWSKGSWKQSSGGTGNRTHINITDCPNNMIKNGWRIEKTDGSGAVDIGQANIPIEYGRSYTLSCYAKGTGKLRLQIGNSNYVNEIFIVSSSWKRYVLYYTFTSSDPVASGEKTNVFFGAPENGNNIYVCGMKLELGIINNPIWIPSPYDYQRDILDRLAVIEKQLNIVSSDEPTDDMEIN